MTDLLQAAAEAVELGDDSLSNAIFKYMWWVHDVASKTDNRVGTQSAQYALCVRAMELEKRVKELETDAARYRWLRDSTDPDLCVRGDESKSTGSFESYGPRDVISGLDLDVLIDAARTGDSHER